MSDSETNSGAAACLKECPVCGEDNECACSAECSCLRYCNACQRIDFQTEDELRSAMLSNLERIMKLANGCRSFLQSALKTVQEFRESQLAAADRILLPGGKYPIEHMMQYDEFRSKRHSYAKQTAAHIKLIEITVLSYLKNLISSNLAFHNLQLDDDEGKQLAVQWLERSRMLIANKEDMLYSAYAEIRAGDWEMPSLPWALPSVRYLTHETRRNGDDDDIKPSCSTDTTNDFRALSIAETDAEKNETKEKKEMETKNNAEEPDVQRNGRLISVKRQLLPSPPKAAIDCNPFECIEPSTSLADSPLSPPQSPEPEGTAARVSLWTRKKAAYNADKELAYREADLSQLQQLESSEMREDTENKVEQSNGRRNEDSNSAERLLVSTSSADNNDYGAFNLRRPRKPPIYSPPPPPPPSSSSSSAAAAAAASALPKRSAQSSGSAAVSSWIRGLQAESIAEREMQTHPLQTIDSSNVQTDIEKNERSNGRHNDDRKSQLYSLLSAPCNNAACNNCNQFKFGGPSTPPSSPPEAALPLSQRSPAPGAAYAVAGLPLSARKRSARDANLHDLCEERPAVPRPQLFRPFESPSGKGVQEKTWFAEQSIMRQNNVSISVLDSILSTLEDDLASGLRGPSTPPTSPAPPPTPAAQHLSPTLPGPSSVVSLAARKLKADHTNGEHARREAHPAQPQQHQLYPFESLAADQLSDSSGWSMESQSSEDGAMQRDALNSQMDAQLARLKKLMAIRYGESYGGDSWLLHAADDDMTDDALLALEMQLAELDN